jgi:hypothetical protein
VPHAEKQRNLPQKRRGEETKEGATPKQEERRNAASSANRPAGNWKDSSIGSSDHLYPVVNAVETLSVKIALQAGAPTVTLDLKGRQYS